MMAVDDSLAGGTEATSAAASGTRTSAPGCVCCSDPLMSRSVTCVAAANAMSGKMIQWPNACGSECRLYVGGCEG